MKPSLYFLSSSPRYLCQGLFLWHPDIYHHILIGLQHLIHTVAHLAFLQCNCHSISLPQNLSKSRFWPCEPHNHILNCSYCYFTRVLYLEPDFKFLEATPVFPLTLVVFLSLSQCRTQRRGYIQIDLLLKYMGLQQWFGHWEGRGVGWRYDSSTDFSYHCGGQNRYCLLNPLVFWWGISHRYPQFILSTTCQDRCYFAYFTGRPVNDGVEIKTPVFPVPKLISFSL